jgi:SAM-dependent methyltransferase
MLAPVDGPLIDALQLDVSCRIADIACGGGGTTLQILRRAPAGSIVHGFDISGILVETARNRVPAGEHAIAFEVADISKAKPPQSGYERLISRFGIMFFDDPLAAFRNLRRWLTPGGRFAFAVWGSLEDNPWTAAIGRTVAEIVNLPKPDPEAPGPFRYADAGKLISLLQEAGFSNVRANDWRGAVAIGGGLPAAEAANFALASSSAFSELLAEAGSEVSSKVRELLTARLLPHEKNGAVRMEACVHIVSGVC